MNKKLSSDLKRTLNTHPIYSQRHVNETVDLVCKEYGVYRAAQRIGYSEFLCRQISFIGKKVWMYQGAILTFMCFLLNIVFQGDLQYIVNRHTPEVLCFYAVFIAVTGLSALQRSRKYRMYEVELACCSIFKLLSSRVIIIAVGDSVFLAAVALIVLNRVSMSMAFIAVYLLMPFLICCCGCIFVLGFKPGQYSVFICKVFCAIILPVQFLFHRLIPQAYYNTSLTGWVICSIFFTVILVFQMYKLITKSTRMCDHYFVDWSDNYGT